MTSHWVAPLTSQFCMGPAVTMPLQVPPGGQVGSQLYPVSVVIIRVNVISFTCDIGKYLLLLPLAVNFPCISSLVYSFLVPVTIMLGKGAAV